MIYVYVIQYWVGVNGNSFYPTWAYLESQLSWLLIIFWPPGSVSPDHPAEEVQTQYQVGPNTTKKWKFFLTLSPCSSYRTSEITENMFCAGFDRGKIDACQVSQEFWDDVEMKTIISWSPPGRQWGSCCVEGGGGTLLHSDRSVCLHSCSLKIFFSVSVASRCMYGNHIRINEV